MASLFSKTKDKQYCKLKKPIDMHENLNQYSTKNSQKKRKPLTLL